MQPLADRLRPKVLSDMVGQSHIIGVINRIIESGNIPNMILYGPTGTGKTTLASIIANMTGRYYIKLNAVNCGVSDIKEVISLAKQDNKYKGIILMLDEIQALNKKQQQALLEVIEDGTVTLIASTADNPYFVVYKAILSRSIVFEFKPLHKIDITKGLLNCLVRLRGSGEYIIDNVEEEALNCIAEMSNGDMRVAINYLELAINLGLNNGNHIDITLDNVLNSATVKPLSYDRGGDEGYSVISAFHKSLRGSDVDAALHYLARLIKAGDIQNITRRLLCVASEDVGLAVPNAVSITYACVSSALQLGFPEARLPLAQATIYLAQCPKSNSVIDAIDKALKDIETLDIGEVPNHLKDAHYSSAAKLGRGVDYKFPHYYPNHWVDQQYMPKMLESRKYYVSGDNKHEKAYKDYWKAIKNSGK